MGVLATPRAPAPEPQPEERPERRWAVPALIVLLAAGTVLLLHAGRRTGFYFDEWNFVQDRRAWTLDALLKPHNEHLSLVPVLVFKILFSTVGIGSYLPYRLSITVLHLGVVALLFVYARRRVGPALALLACALILFLGPAYVDILWAFQIGFLGSLAFGLGALLALDREDRRGDILASGLMVGALYSSSLGLPLFAVFALEILGRPDRRRRWPVLIAPVVLYGLWYVTYGVGDAFTIDNALATPRYITEAAAGAVGALVGLDSNYGRTLVVLLAIALWWTVRRLTAVPWRLAALVAAPLIFWGLTGLARANLNEPAASRYLYPGGLLVLLIAIEAARGQRLRNAALVLAVALTAAAVVSNIGVLRSGAGFLRDQNTRLGGALAATEVAGTRFPPLFAPDPTDAPQVITGTYLAAVRDLGSPAATLRGAPEATRTTADDAMVRGYALSLVAAPSATGSGAAPGPAQVAGATVTTSGSCLVVTPTAAGATVTVPVPAGGLSASGIANVSLRRWGDEFRPALAPPAGAVAVTLKIPSDGDRTPWVAQLPIIAPARICAAG